MRLGTAKFKLFNDIGGAFKAMAVILLGSTFNTYTAWKQQGKSVEHSTHESISTTTHDIHNDKKKAYFSLVM